MRTMVSVICLALSVALFVVAGAFMSSPPPVFYIAVALLGAVPAVLGPMVCRLLGAAIVAIALLSGTHP